MTSPSASTARGISIPYGSIRGRVVFKYVAAVYLISIPYGSIRGIKEIPHLTIFSLFQFLMVRLEEIPKIGNRTLDLISIPYGSIRGASNTGDRSSASNNFNSLWFD